MSKEDLSVCEPYLTNAQMGKTHSVNGTLLDPDGAAIPCGIIALSVFNDTFELYTPETASLENQQDGKVHINKNNIAWDSDISLKFNNLEEDWEAKQWIDMTNRK